MVWNNIEDITCIWLKNLLVSNKKKSSEKNDIYFSEQKEKKK